MQRFFDLASKYQDFPTPFLLIDRQMLCERAAEFLARARGCRVHYAVKANSDVAVLEVLDQCGVGFEVATEAELNQLRALGVSIDKIITSSPIKPPAFIEAMHRLGAKQFVADSLNEVEKLARLAAGADLLVRLAVDNSSSAWPLDEKFGIDADGALALLARGRALGLNAAGVTFHVGSQCTDLKAWAGALDLTRSLWSRAGEAGMTLHTLNIGGGFPAHHQEHIPPVQEIFDFVHDYVRSHFPADVRLQAEPGRALVADAGVLVTTAIGKAKRAGADWLFLDAGVFNGLMEATGGISYRFLPTLSSEPERRWAVAGPSCDSVDVVTKSASLPEPAEGERILIFPAGAYTTVYASAFNGQPIPKVVLA